MKKLFTLLFIVSIFSIDLSAQGCPPGAVSSTGNPTSLGTTTFVGAQAGTQVCFDVIIGNDYTFSTCNTTGDDTEITVFEPAGNEVAENDDSDGPGCDGALQSEVTYTATTTEICVQVETFACDGAASDNPTYDIEVSCAEAPEPPPPPGTCVAGDEQLFFEDFDACALPAGWSVSSTDGGTEAGGDFIFTGMSGDVPGGGTASAGFVGCIAIIDDDANDAIGVGCISTPEIDLSECDPCQPLSLSFDWQTNEFLGDGFFEVSVNGTPIFFNDQSTFGSSSIDLSAFAGQAVTIDFCYDDEGAFAWGVGFDNVLVCHTPLDCAANAGTLSRQ